jgi:microcystin-dependent protein
MSYSSGIDQRFLFQTFFNNTIAEDQPITATNLSLIANLRYVQNWLSSIIVNYLPILNPNFKGTLTSSTGGNISLTNTNSYLSVPTITGNVNFTGQPTVQYNNTKYQISVRAVGDIKMFISNIAPNNHFLKCDGTLYSTTSYSQLFAVIGYTYGGSGSSFAVPDFTSAFPIGANSANSTGCAISNFASGNGQGGATNTYSPSVNFGGAYTASPPILTKVPPHTHLINDPGHSHRTGLDGVTYDLIPIPPIYNVVIPGNANNFTLDASTGITVLSTGMDIQLIDPVSGLSGVNITPPYVAVFYYIAFN